ncbi:MAG TPA: ABC transporter permease [Candidatus Cybelea sp.]|jgi:phospholipid/cholesterol/gamma-HCH transport system permease protein|nr:ABC transporter permease [Candidatus Cybelea sp.]
MSHDAKVPDLWASQDAPQAAPLAGSTLASLWRPINELLEWFGEIGVFVWQVMRATVRRPFEGRELMRQLDEVGAKSLPMVAMAGAAIGAVLALESRHSLIRFGAKAMLPAAIVFSIIHETGPVVTGLVVSGRVGAGIGAELGSMKVTEQIDAIEASGVNPYKLLAFTRILACVLMLPLLTLAADFAGVATGWIATTLAEPMSFQKFLHAGFAGASFSDFLAPTFRTMVFGLIIGVIACFQGMRSQGGTEGVGRSATSSVVLSSLFVMLADVILTKLILVFFP